jgi:hypothetical protein
MLSRRKFIVALGSMAADSMKAAAGEKASSVPVVGIFVLLYAC